MSQAESQLYKVFIQMKLSLQSFQYPVVTRLQNCGNQYQEKAVLIRDGESHKECLRRTFLPTSIRGGIFLSDRWHIFQRKIRASPLTVLRCEGKKANKKFAILCAEMDLFGPAGKELLHSK